MHNPKNIILYNVSLFYRFKNTVQYNTIQYLSLLKKKKYLSCRERKEKQKIFFRVLDLWYILCNLFSLENIYPVYVRLWNTKYDGHIRIESVMHLLYNWFKNWSFVYNFNIFFTLFHFLVIFFLTKTKGYSFI
jgi:hypothetical protein